MSSVDYGEKVKTQNGSGMMRNNGTRELAECLRGAVDFSNIIVLRSSSAVSEYNYRRMSGLVYQTVHTEI